MSLPFNAERYGKLTAELNMLMSQGAREILASASESAVLRTLESFEIPDEIYWKFKIEILEQMIAALKDTPRPQM